MRSEEYAFTGCFGEMPRNAPAFFDFNPLPDVGGAGLVVPAAHGPWQLVPAGWSGTRGIRTDDRGSPGPSHEQNYTASGDLAVARAEPEWRAALPPGWTFAGAFSGPLTDTTSGYCASWNDAAGRPAVEVCETHRTAAYDALPATLDGGAAVREFRTILGRPALVAHSPPGPNHDSRFRVEVAVHDAATETTYAVSGLAPSLAGANVEAVIAIARAIVEHLDAR